MDNWSFWLKNQMNKYLYLPTEIIVREQEGKATLAGHALKRDWTVILGAKLELYAIAHKIPPGVFIIKSAMLSELKQIKMLKRYGHKVCSLDEEGVVTYKIFLNNNYRYCSETLEKIDKIFVWGKEQKKIFLKKFSKFSNKIIVTGNPRVDYWMNYSKKIYLKDVKKIKKQYKNFIFFASSFGIANNIYKKDGVKLSLDQYDKKNKTLNKFLFDQAEYNKKNLAIYKDLIFNIANKNKNINIIVRPHPSEDFSMWKKMAKELDNIKFIYKGSITKWILASKVLLHFKSTSSLESVFLNKPAITYLPIRNKKFDLKLPLQCSEIFTNEEKLIKFLNMKNITIKNKKNKLINSWVQNDKILSSEKIIKYIENIYIGSSKNLDYENQKIPLFSRYNFELILDFFNSNKLLKFFLPKIFKRKYKFSKGLSRKYYGFNPNLIKRIIFEINKTKNFNFQKITKNLILIKK